MQQLREHGINAGSIVIAGQALSLRATTRNPVLAYHWIPDRVRDDSHRVRDDNLLTRDDNLLTRDDKLLTRDDKS